MAHEILVDLFKHRPSLGPELLTEALGVEVPRYTEATLESIDITQIRPAQYRADVVVLLLRTSPRGARNRSRLASPPSS